MATAELIALALASAQPILVPVSTGPAEAAVSVEVTHQIPEPIAVEVNQGIVAAADPALADPALSNAKQAEADNPAPGQEPGFDEITKADDPFEPFNRISFDFSMAVDKVIIRPMAMLYRQVVPKPARDGTFNFMQNIGEPMVLFNDVLQLRPDRVVRTLGRFVINTLIGVGGLFDVAKRKPFNLAHHGNSYGNTLGYYGMKTGPYIYIPILGPTTVRDQIDRAPDPIRLVERIIGKSRGFSTYGIASSVIDGLNQRERNDDDLKAMLEDAVDRYATFRENYLQNKQGEIAELKAK